VGGAYDGTISGKVLLQGSLTKDSLTQVIDPSKDLYTSFTLSGSAPEMYDRMSVTAGGIPAGCTLSVSQRTPDVMTVKTGADPQLSQVQYKFNPHYDPQAVTLNGVQLCSFCPVYRKTPVKVELWVNPGKPTETLLATCRGVSQSIPGVFWWSGWAENHASDPTPGFIMGWDLQADPFLASKTIMRTYSDVTGSYTENTQLKLKPFSQ
jgi:hypothetical protein